VTRELRRLFPRLSIGTYRVTSRKSKKYNCLAWAAGRDDVWWQSPPDGEWPNPALDDGSVESAVRLFEHLGYERTADSALEDGWTKVAIYGDADGYTHAARQREDGRWTSKLGALHDIEHDTLESLTQSDYGFVVQILKKRTER
jgi:hypothetical protein